MTRTWTTSAAAAGEAWALIFSTKSLITPDWSCSNCAVSILAGPGGRVAGTQSRPDQGAAMMRGYGSVAVAEAAAVTVPP